MVIAGGVYLIFLRARDFERAEGGLHPLRYASYGGIGYYLVSILVTLLIIAFCAVIAWPAIQAHAFNASAIAAIIVGVVLFLFFMVVAGYIYVFLEDFIMPLMYIHRCRASQAWRLFLVQFKQSRGSFILYGLFLFVLNMGLGMVMVTLIILTCCCAAIVFAIPYLNAVLLLPAIVLFRLYSLEFIKQIGPEFAVWQVPPPPPEVDHPSS